MVVTVFDEKSVRDVQLRNASCPIVVRAGNVVTVRPVHDWNVLLPMVVRLAMEIDVRFVRPDTTLNTLFAIC